MKKIQLGGFRGFSKHICSSFRPGIGLSNSLYWSKFSLDDIGLLGWLNLQAALKYLAKLKRINLLILDDFGVSPLKAAEARDLLEIVEDRVNQSSLIVTSQLAIKDWHGYLHNATIADAILDRIVHNAYKIEIHGGSQRKENAKKTMK